MTDEAVIEGGCLCGNVRYRMTGPVSQAAYCHCEMCRKSGGAPVSAWISVAKDRFSFIKGKPGVYTSSEDGRRRFCPKCGGQLTFESVHNPDYIAVTVGTLDDPHAHPPRRHFWASSALSWAHLDDGLPVHMEVLPGPKE